MSNTTIQLKFSTTIGNTPTQLANGEVAINGADGKLFYSEPDGTINFIENFRGPSGLNTEIQFNDEGELGTDSTFTFDKSNNRLNVATTRINNIFDLSANTVTTNSTNETTLFSFPTSEYASAKFIVQAKKSEKRQITELILIHDDTSAFSTEYAIIRTDENLFNLAVDVNSGIVSLKTASTSSETTIYNITANLILQ